MILKFPATKDMMQSKKKLKIPEIRVWCHPIDEDDFYYTFGNFKDAFVFIKKNKKIAEDTPLLAFNDYEINLFEGKK